MGNERSVEVLRHGVETNRAPGPHVAPTGFAGMALLSVAGFWLVTEEDDQMRRWIVLILSALTTLCTVSRHAMVAAIIGLAVSIALSETKKRGRLIMLVGLAAILISTPAVG